MYRLYAYCVALLAILASLTCWEPSVVSGQVALFMLFFLIVAMISCRAQANVWAGLSGILACAFYIAFLCTGFNKAQQLIDSRGPGAGTLVLMIALAEFLLLALPVAGFVMHADSKDRERSLTVSAV